MNDIRASPAGSVPAALPLERVFVFLMGSVVIAPSGQHCERTQQKQDFQQISPISCRFVLSSTGEFHDSYAQISGMAGYANVQK